MHVSHDYGVFLFSNQYEEYKYSHTVLLSQGFPTKNIAQRYMPNNRVIPVLENPRNIRNEYMIETL